jgi:diketogulonate reductase-like aldo/keto reductase
MKLIEATPDSGRSYPQINLCNGRTIPALGLRTFKPDLYMAEQIAGAVDFAIRNVYRYIDCAPVYMITGKLQVHPAEVCIHSPSWGAASR